MVRSETNRSPELLTLPAAASRAGLGLRQIRRARDVGQLPVYRIGGWDRVRWLDVLAWIESRRREARGPGS